MDFSLALLSLSCLCGIVSAQFGLPPFNNRPEDAQFMPRYSAGSGNNNYNNYNGANNGPDNGGNGGDSLAQLGLGGLSGFYSALTNELQYAGNSLGAPTTPGPSSGSTVKVADTTVEASTVKYTTKAAVETNDNRGNNNNNNNNNYGNGNGSPQFGGAPLFGNGGGYGGPSPFTGQAGPGFGGPSPFGPQGGPGGYGDQSPYGGQGGYGGGPNNGPFGGGPNNGPFGGGPNNGPFGGAPNNGPYGGGPNNGPYGGGPNNGPADNGPAPTGPVNLGDTSVLKKMGLEQLGSFFGSMVSELNNAGAQVGGPVAHTTPKSIVPAQAVTVAPTTASS